MRNSSEILRNALDQAGETLRSIVDLDRQIGTAANLIAECLRAGNKLLVCGNGGSAADAADFCTEFACRFVQDRRPYPAMNLSQGGSLITATGNDYGFDQIFARQIQALGRPGDVVIAITTSGNSPNVIEGVKAAKRGNLKTIGLSGKDGGLLAKEADVTITIASPSTARIQECHIGVGHLLCELTEEDLEGGLRERKSTEDPAT